MSTERFDTVIVGGGQAGLATGYFLGKKGRSYVALDAHERIGDAWRKRWDSLRLFTPAHFSRLPGMRIPGAKNWDFVTKDAMADYLESYATRFGIPVRTGHRVDRVSREGERFVVTAGDRRFEADNVVIAAGGYNLPNLPPFAGDLDPGIVQIHSGAYRSPSQLRPGRVLVVGAGNSGAEIAFEVIQTHETTLAGKVPGQIPFPHGSLPFRFGFRVLRFAGHRVITRGWPVGRKMAAKMLAKADPLIRRRVKDLDRAGIVRVGRVAGVENGMPVLEDGRVVEVENVIWCTGFGYDFSWIDLPVFGEDGVPVHDRGVVATEPGLYFVGLIFQHSFSSEALPNRGRDARYIAERIAAGRSTARSSEKVPA
ncbi:MAG TPA: NAD(P)-binding domain-containing protein [Actinomycetota bacterium]|nr:NAD(P)-binding domain-containing protein [Actinomycetota bacterium]